MPHPMQIKYKMNIFNSESFYFLFGTIFFSNTSGMITGWRWKWYSQIEHHNVKRKKQSKMQILGHTGWLRIELCNQKTKCIPRICRTVVVVSVNIARIFTRRSSNVNSKNIRFPSSFRSNSLQLNSNNITWHECCSEMKLNNML